MHPHSNVRFFVCTHSERIQNESDISLQYYGKPLVITYSGGKDSEVMLSLAQKSGIPFVVHHSHTTADAPETVRFIRQRFQDLCTEGINCSMSFPHYKGKRISFWELIPIKAFPPTRVQRYCCQVLKESSRFDSIMLTGVRWDESTKRMKGRGIFEVPHRDMAKRLLFISEDEDLTSFTNSCEQQKTCICNPIVDWTTHDIWSYIESQKIQVNPLYQLGFSRVGCIGCPIANRKRYREFRLYPKYQQMYIRAFDRMLEVRRQRNLVNKLGWKTGLDVFDWWMETDTIKGQLSF